MAQSGLLQAKAGAADDIKGTTGQYDSSLGAPATKRSGRAILAREKQGDTGTYHYIDNLARAIRYATRQLVDMIPKIYDTQRIARIIGLDGETDQAMIDPTQPDAGQEDCRPANWHCHQEDLQPQCRQVRRCGD
jgi:predicted NBD/HSP70 family sugar kinase